MTAWGILDPFLTIYFHDLFGSYTKVAILTALLYFFSLLASLPFGGLADVVSKKKLIHIFLILYIPLGFVLAALSTFFQFALFRIYHALLATGLWSSAESYVRVNSPPHKASESMGFFDSAISLSLVIGPVIGGILMTAFGIKSLFFIFPVFVIAAISILPSMPDHHGISNIWRGIKQIRNKKMFSFELSDFFNLPGMITISALSFISRSVAAGTMLILPLFSDDLGANFVVTGLIFAVFALPTVFEAPFSVFADKFDRKKILIIGGTAAIVFFAAAFVSDGLTSLFVLSLFIALALALITPTIEGFATELMPRHKIGELNGVYRSVGLLAGACGSFIVGPIADKFSIQAPFLFGAALMAVFLLIVIFLKLPSVLRSS